MPISTTLRKLLCCAPGRQEEEEAEVPARRPLPEPVADEPVQPGRPYRDFVESEAERYWQEMVKVGSLTKPNQQEIRAGATRVLGLAQRYRPGWKLNPALNRAHMAAIAVQLHLVESGRLKHPFTLVETSHNYVEALIQLAHDAGWLAREIPLPDHPPPKHPTIYYSIDPASGPPVPREDSLIRGDYVYDLMDGSRITQNEFIYPWRGPDIWPSVGDLTSQGGVVYYTLTGPHPVPRDVDSERLRITYHWVDPVMGSSGLMRRTDRTVFTTPLGDNFIMGIYFSPHPPSREEINRFLIERYKIIFELRRLDI